MHVQHSATETMLMLHTCYALHLLSETRGLSLLLQTAASQHCRHPLSHKFVQTAHLNMFADFIAHPLPCCHPCCSVNEAEVKHRQAECQEPSMLCCCCLPQVNEYADMGAMVSLQATAMAAAC